MIGLRKTTAQTVADLLDTQHRALLGGDLAVLGRMAPDLERAFERMRRDGGPLAEVEHIKEAAARNARLLMAAQSGIATARAHLQSSRTPELTTYGADGRSQTASAAPSRTIARG